MVYYRRFKLTPREADASLASVGGTVSKSVKLCWHTVAKDLVTEIFSNKVLCGKFSCMTVC